ncbi:hypothetical protein ACJX0J_005546, partial [Zea mays]
NVTRGITNLKTYFIPTHFIKNLLIPNYTIELYELHYFAQNGLSPYGTTSCLAGYDIRTCLPFSGGGSVNCYDLNTSNSMGLIEIVGFVLFINGDLVYTLVRYENNMEFHATLFYFLCGFIIYMQLHDVMQGLGLLIDIIYFSVLRIYYLNMIFKRPTEPYYSKECLSLHPEFLAESILWIHKGSTSHRH